MKDDRLYEYITSEEGTRDEVYQCPAGANTIGVGHNIDANGLPEYINEYLLEHKKITPEHIQKLLKDDVKVARLGCEAIFGKDEFRLLSYPRQAVLISMVFQMGYKGVSKFKNTIQLIKERRFEEASENMLKSKWAEQTPARAEKAANIMRENIWL